jgi:hypothetical protein
MADQIQKPSLLELRNAEHCAEGSSDGIVKDYDISRFVSQRFPDSDPDSDRKRGNAATIINHDMGLRSVPPDKVASAERVFSTEELRDIKRYTGTYKPSISSDEVQKEKAWLIKQGFPDVECADNL